MAIRHKNAEFTWSDSFASRNAILETTPYRPEVLFVGTFNPSILKYNFSDFFYGRGYFWPAFMNIIVHQKIVLTGPRIGTNTKRKPAALLPSVDEILTLCNQLKLCFADLILEVLHNNSAQYRQIEDNDNIRFEGKTYNLIRDGRDGPINGLEQLADLGQVHWNTEKIIDFLNGQPSIKYVFLTRQPTGIWKNQWSEIAKQGAVDGRTFTIIHTPSAQGLRGGANMDMLIDKWMAEKNHGIGKWLFEMGAKMPL